MTDHPNQGSSDPSPLPYEPAPGHRPDFWSRLDDNLGAESSPVRSISPEVTRPRWSQPGGLMVAAALLLVVMVGAVVALVNRPAEPVAVTTEGPDVVATPEPATPVPPTPDAESNPAIPSTPEPLPTPTALPPTAPTPTDVGPDPVDVPTPDVGPVVRVCTAGDLTTWGPESVRMRFTEFEDRIVVQYAYHGEASFNRGAEGQAVVLRTDGLPVVDEAIDRYLGTDETAFTFLVRDEAGVLSQRADLASTVTCDWLFQDTEADTPLAPQSLLVDGPYACSYDPDLGPNPLGMRSFVSIETAADGRVQWIFWQFGNAANDGAGFITAVLTADEVAARSADALELLPTLADELRLDDDLAQELVSLMSCSRNPDEWSNSPVGFPHDAESQASRDANGIEGNEGNYFFESESYEWSAHLGRGDNRCNGMLSYDIDVTDRQSRETATAIQNIPADRITAVDVDEDQDWVFLLSECLGQSTLRTGRLNGVASWDAIDAYELGELANATGVSFDGPNNFRVAVQDGPDVLIVRSFDDLGSDAPLQLTVPLLPLGANDGTLDDPLRQRRIYGAGTDGIQDCASPDAADSNVSYLLAVGDDNDRVEYVGLMGQFEPVIDRATLSPNGASLAIPADDPCVAGGPETIVVLPVDGDGLTVDAILETDRLEPDFGAGYEITQLEFRDIRTLRVTALRSDGTTAETTVAVG